MTPGRDDLGSWLEGTPERNRAGAPSAADPSGAGRAGVGRAGVGRRLAALSVDWAASLAVAALVAPTGEPALVPLLAADPMATLAVFGLSTTVLVALLGHTVGHRLLGVRVARAVDGEPVDGAPGLLRAAVRTALLCLVVPAVVWDRSGRGMHDAAAGTVIVRR